MATSIIINFRFLRRLLAAVVIFLWGMSALFSVINYLVRTFSTSAEFEAIANRVFMTFYLDAEFNLPTWFSSFILLASAVVILVIAYVLHEQHKPYYVRHWLGLSGFFLLGSLDEFIGFHEAAGGIFGDLIKLRGFYAWPILGVIGIGSLIVIYWRLVAALPLHIRRLFALAAVVLVGGAVGFEVIQGFFRTMFGDASGVVELITYIEEGLEFSGMVIFFYTFVAYLATILTEDGICFSFQPE
jgi:hypothetical protein